jgi:hypothetical protein
MISLLDLSMAKKGQSALESFMLFVIILGLVLPILFFGGITAGETFRINQGEDSLKAVAITANIVANLGQGNYDVSTVSLPSGITESYSENTTLVIVVEGKELQQEVKGLVIGSLPKVSGLHSVSVKAVDVGLVKVGNGPYMYEIDPPCRQTPAGAIRDNIYGVDFEQGITLYANGEKQNNFGGDVTKDKMTFIVAGIQNSLPVINGTDTFYTFQLKNPDGVWSNTLTYVRVPSNGSCDAYVN